MPKKTALACLSNQVWTIPRIHTTPHQVLQI
jgi:hypothetical protein